MKTRGIISLVIALALMITVGFAPANAEEPNVFSLFQNSTLDLSPYEGKALFINFFTEWCPYCMQEMPDIKKVFDTYSKNDLQIILVHVWDGENEKNTRNVREKYGLEEMTFFEDEDRGLTQQIGLQGYPTSLFIHKDGTLAAVTYAMNYEQMADMMETLGVPKAEDAEHAAGQ